MKAATDLQKLIKTPIKSKFFSTNSNSLIHYVTVGEKGPPLILLHGLNIGWGQWYPNIKKLSRKLSLYIPDLPGCGKSSFLNFRACDFEKDIVLPLEQWIIKNKLKYFSILGHSLGAAVAAKISGRNPQLVKKIILVDPVGLTNQLPTKFKLLSVDLFTQFLIKVAIKPSKKNMETFLKSVMFKNIELPKEFTDYYFELVLSRRQHPLAVLSSFTENFGVRKDVVFQNDLLKFKKVIFFIYGNKDPLMQKRSLYETIKVIPHIKVFELKDTGHVPNIEAADLFNQTVESILLR